MPKSPEPIPSCAPLWFEDFYVGLRFQTESATLEVEAIQAFAAAFDPQPFHLDPEAAKGSFFGGLVASGWHTAASTMRLLVDGGISVEGGLIGAGCEIQWPQAARPGDVLTVYGEVTEVAPSRSARRGFITLRCETRNQRDEVLQIFTCRLVAPKRNVDAQT